MFSDCRFLDEHSGNFCRRTDGCQQSTNNYPNFWRTADGTADYLIADEKRLPFSKTEIKEAILFAIPLVDKEMCEQLRFGYVQLGMFQPVSEIRMLDIPDNISSLSDEQIFNFAKKVMVEFDEDWFAINRFVIDDMKSLLKEIPKC